MTTAEETAAAEHTDRHATACEHAFAWAERATIEYDQAVRHENDARGRQQYDSGWQRDRATESRAAAQYHGVRSTEALKLAEMWARVARVLVPPLEPVWAELETAELDSTTATPQ
ncbi:hypothetical protein [Streptomyces antibioticus]|uniref:hypothetical protein n=1 Tax=Streptomyces antibioticus TaxID=1890 RepID=UPI0036C85BCF